MVFNSLTFIVFFAIVLILFWMPFSWTTRKIILLVASYLFSAAWNPPFIILLWISTVVDWWAANRIAYSSGALRRRRGRSQAGLRLPEPAFSGRWWP